MMGKAIEKSGRHFGVSEDGGPFAEAQIGGDDDACQRRRQIVPDSGVKVYQSG